VMVAMVRSGSADLFGVDWAWTEELRR
jgi:hypothetical protein